MDPLPEVRCLKKEGEQKIWKDHLSWGQHGHRERKHLESHGNARRNTDGKKREAGISMLHTGSIPAADACQKPITSNKLLSQSSLLGLCIPLHSTLQSPGKHWPHLVKSYLIVLDSCAKMNKTSLLQWKKTWEQWVRRHHKKCHNDLTGLLGRLSEVLSVECLVRHSAWYPARAQ